MKNYKLTALYIIKSKKINHNKSQRFHNTDEYYVLWVLLHATTLK